MNLSKFTDYSFRCLIYLAKNQEEKTNVEELSKILDLSENHIKKIVHSLAKAGFLKSYKGRNGGIELGKPLNEINLKDIILHCEDFSKMVECKKNGTICTFADKKCLIKDICNKGINSFLKEFEGYTLKDVLEFE